MGVSREVLKKVRSHARYVISACKNVYASYTERLLLIYIYVYNVIYFREKCLGRTNGAVAMLRSKYYGLMSW